MGSQVGLQVGTLGVDLLTLVVGATMDPARPDVIVDTVTMATIGVVVVVVVVVVVRVTGRRRKL